MPPASAIATRSSIVGRKHGESHRGLAAVDEPFQLGRAADAADEVDPLVGALVADAEDGASTRSCRRWTSRLATGSAIAGAGVERQQVPAGPGQRYIAHSPLRAGAGPPGADRYACARRRPGSRPACGRAGP